MRDRLRKNRKFIKRVFCDSCQLCLKVGACNTRVAHKKPENPLKSREFVSVEEAANAGKF
nr:MAG TPA_asm: hypothetical protein [Caudoviricetes sp.]